MALAAAEHDQVGAHFARLAQKHLTPEDVTGMAGAFGFGAPLPFAVPNEAPQITMPEDPLEFARWQAYIGARFFL